MTYPSMFMGVGNLIVYLFSLIILIVAAVWAGYARSYNEHLGARMLLGFAAGQSEALIPMMIQVRASLHYILIKD